MNYITYLLVTDIIQAAGCFVAAIICAVVAWHCFEKQEDITVPIFERPTWKTWLIVSGVLSFMLFWAAFMETGDVIKAIYLPELRVYESYIKSN